MTGPNVEEVRANLRRGEEEKAARLRNHPGIKALEAWQREQDEAERLEREQREQERRERREQESEAQAARLEEEARGQFLASGGTAAEFEDAWPSMKTEILKRRALEATELARRATAESYRGSF